METIIWNDSYSVGNESLDLQHKEVLSIISKLVVNDGALAMSEISSEVLRDIRKYAKEHFEYEERLLEQNSPEHADRTA